MTIYGTDNNTTEEFVCLLICRLYNNIIKDELYGSILFYYRITRKFDHVSV